MSRADVPVRIRGRVVQVAVHSAALQAVVRVAAVIREAHRRAQNPLCNPVIIQTDAGLDVQITYWVNDSPIKGRKASPRPFGASPLL